MAEDITSRPMNGFSELQIAGTVATPDDADWDQLRQAWNLAADPHPAAVAFVENADDVAATLRFAAEHDLRVLGQGTGHGAVAVGSLDDTIVIKTERMRSVSVDGAHGAGRGRGAGRGARRRGTEGRQLLAAGLVAQRGRDRLHAWRWVELARAQVRLRLQPRQRDRAGHRRRRGPDGRRRQRARAVLGPARRRRLVRGRHRAAARAAADRRGLRRHRHLPGGGRRDRDQGLP